jgi:hypothetical protein
MAHMLEYNVCENLQSGLVEGGGRGALHGKLSYTHMTEQQRVIHAMHFVCLLRLNAHAGVFTVRLV